MEEVIDAYFGAQFSISQERPLQRAQDGEAIFNNISSDLLFPNVLSFTRLSHLIYSAQVSHLCLVERTAKNSQPPELRRTSMTKTMEVRMSPLLDSMIRIKRVAISWDQKRTYGFTEDQFKLGEAFAKIAKMSLSVKTELLERGHVRDKMRRSLALQSIWSSEAYISLIQECDSLLVALQSLTAVG